MDDYINNYVIENLHDDVRLKKKKKKVSFKSMHIKILTEKTNNGAIKLPQYQHRKCGVRKKKFKKIDKLN